MIRRRIGLLEDIGVPQASKFHNSPLIICTKAPSIKKYGRAVVRSVEEDIGVFLFPRLCTKLVYGSNHDKIVTYLKESVFGFAVVVTSKELSPNHKKDLESIKPDGKVKLVVINKPAVALDIGGGRLLKIQSDLDAPLYEPAVPRKLKATTSSSPSHKTKTKATPKAKVKAVESASPNPPKDSGKKEKPLSS